MKVKWVVQNNMLDVDSGEIINEVSSQGMVCYGISHTLGFNKIEQLSKSLKEDCVVCYGDIDFVINASRKLRCIPGAWCNFTNMKCSTYYSHFGSLLLNRNYVMMPLNELLIRRHQKEFLIDQLLFAEPVFVRPDSGAKSFTGQVIGLDDMHKIQSLVNAVGGDTLVVVSPTLDISEEFRLVVCDRRIIAASKYLPEEEPLKIEDIPTSLLCLANKVCSNEWQPDICYTLDIAVCEEVPYLLEINSFSCSGFYGCDIGDIVSAASNAAFDEWNSYHV